MECYLKSDKQRFFEKIKHNGLCWEWKGCKLESGYGMFSLNGKLGYAHRASYILFRGLIQTKFVVHHLCKNRSCVNPIHLESITQKDNLLKGDSFQGANGRKTHCIHGHKLTPDNCYTSSGYRDCKTCRKIRDENKETIR